MTDTEPTMTLKQKILDQDTRGTDAPQTAPGGALPEDARLMPELLHALATRLGGLCVVAVQTADVEIAAAARFDRGEIAFTPAPRFVALDDAADLIERLVRQRDELQLSVRAADAANKISGLIGVSAHDLHLEMEKALSAKIQRVIERAEKAEAELAKADALLRRERANNKARAEIDVWLAARQSAKPTEGNDA